MNTVEKLEQSGIVKEKGTQYFKVCMGSFIFQALELKREFPRHTLLKTLFSHALISYAAGGKIQAGISAVQKDCVMAGT